MTTPTHPELLALVAKWREDAGKLRRMAGKSQRRDDPLQADVLFANAQDADGYADELQSAIDSLAAHSDDGLDFEPDEQHAVADMANVGYSLMQAIARHLPGYVYNDSPAEIVGDLMGDMDDLRKKISDLTGAAHGYKQELESVRAALAAHRGEVAVIGYVRRAPFYTRDVWQGCTKAEHDFINANGYWTNPKDGFNWPSITRPVYDAHPPQAQAGAGDALEDAMLAKAYRQESAAFAADSEISVGAKIERRYRELLAAALEARREPE